MELKYTKKDKQIDEYKKVFNVQNNYSNILWSLHFMSKKTP